MEGKAAKNLKKISGVVAEFVLSEANKRMDSANVAKDILDKKSFTIAAMLVSILGAIISFTTKELSDPNFLIPYLILVVGFVISFFLLAKAIATTRYYGNSFKPSQILNNDEFFLKTKDNLTYLLIDWYDGAITHNCNLNKNRGFFINIALGIALVSLSIFALIYVWLKVST